MSWYKAIIGQIQCGTDIKIPNCGENLTQANISKVVSFVSVVASLVCVIIIILAGLRYITSSGNPDSISKSKNQIIYALIGLVVSLGAYAIVGYVIKKL